MPLFPLYALSFAHAGLSDGRISALFALWSAVGLVTETPAGALADRFSRRGALAAAGLFSAAGFALWTALPVFPAFAAGFALWGFGDALASGTVQALLYDGLAAAGAERCYPRLIGRVDAAALLAQPPTSALAALLYRIGGFPVVGWASVATCVVSAAIALRLPEAPRRAAADTAAAGTAAATPDGYFSTLRAGVTEAVTRPAVRGAVLAVAALTGLDAIEEYVPLLARDWGVPTVLNPVATLVVPLAGAAGAALAGAAARLRPRRIGLLVAGAAPALAAASVLRRPLGLALIAVFYGLYRLVLVTADARLQARIDGAARATVTSVAGLGSEFFTFALYGAWTLGGLPFVTAQVCLTALLSLRLIRGRHPRPGASR